MAQWERVEVMTVNPGLTGWSGCRRQLLVVIEPTGPAWLPIAVFFGRRGHLVVRVSSA